MHQQGLWIHTGAQCTAAHPMVHCIAWRVLHFDALLIAARSTLLHTLPDKVHRVLHSIDILLTTEIQGCLIGHDKTALCVKAKISLRTLRAHQSQPDCELVLVPLRADEQLDIPIV